MHVLLEIVERLLLQQLGEALVRQVVDRDHAAARDRAEEAGEKVVRAEHHVGVDQLHPEHVRRGGERARAAAR